MNIHGHDWSFWIAAIGAALFKIGTSEKQSFRQVLLTGGAALFFAWIATDPFLKFMDWDVETYKVLTAGLMALVGENLMRTLMTLDANKLIDLYKDFKK